MKTKLILAAGALILLGACDESEYELGNLVPEQYHKVLYINDSGTKDITLYNTGEDNTYKLSIFKGGSEPALTANANIGVLSQETVDSEYSIPEAVNYKVVGQECYSFDATQLDFSSEDRFKNVTVSINVPNIEKAMTDNPDAICVLPLYLYSETDSVNVTKNMVFLKLTQVLTPTLGFTTTDLTYKPITVGFTADTTEINFGLDTDNKWDIDCQFEVDADYVDEYNAQNGTSFVALPEGSYSFDKTMVLKGGVTTGKLAVEIVGSSLEAIDYMLPVRFTEASLFEVSEKAVYPLVIRVIGKQFDRSNWSISANTEEKTAEGAGNGVAKCVLDGNIGTMWHSQYTGGTPNLPHELTVDAKEVVTFTHFGLTQRQHATYKDVKAGEFFVSSDNKTWTSVGKFKAEQVYENQIFPVTPMQGRYFKIQITESNRGQNSALAEVYAYGVK